MKEYSKRVLKAIIILWFAGAIYGAGIVTTELIATFMQDNIYGVGVTVHLPELLTYIGAPVTGGIVGYMCKTAFENKEKIKKGIGVQTYPQDQDTATFPPEFTPEYTDDDYSPLG